MITCDNHNKLDSAIQDAKDKGLRIGFVPTMGSLHDGHLSLIEVARQHCDFIVVSIFVNPTQFAPDEDFDSYPRDTKRDVSLLRSANVDCVFLPHVDDIYPRGVNISINAGTAAQGLETDFRPHFFNGVCTVVHRLFDLVRPDVAVFGEKDYQQLMVIREMVEDHALNIDIVGSPIIRSDVGLALSSRNAYLKGHDMVVADSLNVILRQNKDEDPAFIQTVLEHAGFDTVDYVERRWGRLLAAVRIGRTRLIDNIAL